MAIKQAYMLLMIHQSDVGLMTDTKNSDAVADTTKELDLLKTLKAEQGKHTTEIQKRHGYFQRKEGQRSAVATYNPSK